MAFPPDLLTRLTRPLPWPYSAENELRSILNSCTASIESSTLGELNHELRVSTPSIKKLFVSPRPPETWKARSERPDWLVMVALRELYAGMTPDEVEPSCMKLRPLRGSSVIRFSSMTCPKRRRFAFDLRSTGRHFDLFRDVAECQMDVNAKGLVDEQRNRRNLVT